MILLARPAEDRWTATETGRAPVISRARSAVRRPITGCWCACWRAAEGSFCARLGPRSWPQGVSRVVCVHGRAGEAGLRRPGAPRCYANGTAKSQSGPLVAAGSPARSVILTPRSSGLIVSFLGQMSCPSARARSARSASRHCMELAGSLPWSAAGRLRRGRRSARSPCRPPRTPAPAGTSTRPRPRRRSGSAARLSVMRITTLPGTQPFSSRCSLSSAQGSPSWSANQPDDQISGDTGARRQCEHGGIRNVTSVLARYWSAGSPAPITK